MLYINVTSDTPKFRLETVDLGEPVGRSHYFGGIYLMSMSAPVRFFDILQGQTQTQGEREFEEQKKLFEQIPPLLLEPYRGLFVISHNGRILDADSDLDTLTSRFFAEHGDVPIYLDKIGDQLQEVIDTHF